MIVLWKDVLGASRKTELDFKPGYALRFNTDTGEPEVYRPIISADDLGSGRVTMVTTKEDGTEAEVDLRFIRWSDNHETLFVGRDLDDSQIGTVYLLGERPVTMHTKYCNKATLVAGSVDVTIPAYTVTGAEVILLGRKHDGEAPAALLEESAIAFSDPPTQAELTTLQDNLNLVAEAANSTVISARLVQSGDDAILQIRSGVDADTKDVYFAIFNAD
jgi:hypothetical protein